MKKCEKLYLSKADGSFSRRMIFIVHSGGSFTQLFMFTLTCDDLMRQSETIAEAAYRARWHSTISSPASRRLAKDLMFVTMRARRPCSLTAGGFFPISLETFSTVRTRWIVTHSSSVWFSYCVYYNISIPQILSTSISYLTLLRQGQESSTSQ